MRAQLSKGAETIRFIWGDEPMERMPAGQVLVHWFDFNVNAAAVSSQTYNTTFARRYWQRMVELGFKVKP